MAPNSTVTWASDIMTAAFKAPQRHSPRKRRSCMRVGTPQCPWTSERCCTRRWRSYTQHPVHTQVAGLGLSVDYLVHLELLFPLPGQICRCEKVQSWENASASSTRGARSRSAPAPPGKQLFVHKQPPSRTCRVAKSQFGRLIPAASSWAARSSWA